MSEVTNLMISFSIAEDEPSKIAEINTFWNNGRGFRIISADFEKRKNQSWYGGDKQLETPLLIGAYNHLDLTGLLQFLKELEWDEPENVQVMFKTQDSDTFEMITGFK